MDASGNIYELTEEQKQTLLEHVRDDRTREDVARLDGYLKARAEADMESQKAALEAAKREFEEMMSSTLPQESCSLIVDVISSDELGAVLHEERMLTR